MERAEADNLLLEVGLVRAGPPGTASGVGGGDEGSNDGKENDSTPRKSTDAVASGGDEGEDGETLSAIDVLRRLLVVGKLAADDLRAAAAAEAAFSALLDMHMDGDAAFSESSDLSPKGELSHLSDDDVQINFKAPFGQGAFSMVYPVHLRDEQTGEFDVDRQPFALKRLRHAVVRDAAVSKAALADLAHEAKLLSIISHENIIELHGVSKDGVDAGSYFIVLDALADTLDSLMKKWAKKRGFIQQVTPHEKVMFRIRTVAVGIANGMEYLHSKHIIFRDLKPANVGFDRSGIVKIFDFGLARKLQSARITGKAGTLRYMAPEMARGSSYGLSADVFSFALLLWQIITGRVPYEKEIPESNLFEPNVILDNNRPSLKYVESKRMQALLEASWASNPEERPTFHNIGLGLKEIIIQKKVAKVNGAIPKLSDERLWTQKTGGKQRVVQQTGGKQRVVRRSVLYPG